MDETQITEKPKTRREFSHFMGFSARSIITILIVLTACVMSYQGKIVEEPLKVLVVSVVSFYFGQKTANSQSK